MKPNPFPLLLFAATVFISCRKSSGNSSQPDGYLMTVKEYKTKIPLSGVIIKLYKCTNYDNIFGCRAKSAFVSHLTDQNGEYNFTSVEMNQADQGITLSKLQYWDMGGGQGEVLMEPEAIVKLNLTASKIYPDTSIFQLKTTGEFGNASFVTFKAPKDSVYNYRLFGNEKNTIYWIVYTKDPGCYQYCILDTLASGNLTLNPQKFETLNSSLNY